MLQFLRKYQKSLFIVITVVIICSFTFFGTYSAIFNEASSKEDRKVGELVDGTPLKESSLYQLSHFISADKDPYSTSSYPNFFNQKVIEEEFCKSGLLELIVDRHFEELSSDLQERWEKIRKYRPYRHPYAPYLSAENVWSYFAPDLLRTFQEIRQEKEFSKESVRKMVKLYVEEKRFPPFMLQRALIFQEKQLDGVPSDSRIYQEELDLCNFRGANEWFGNKAINLISSFILNTAKVAEKRGYEVSQAKARNTLLQSLTPFQKEMGDVELSDLYRRQLQILGMTEKEALEIERSILLFTAYLRDSSKSVLVDPMLFEEYDSYASLCLDVDRYQMKAPLHLRSIADLSLFECYLNAIGKDNKGLDLPTSFYSENEIRERAPALIQRSFEANVSTLTLDEAALHVPLKEMWSWQVSDAGWKRITSQFSILAAKKEVKASDRFSLLEKLDSEMKKLIDSFSRKEMVSIKPELILSQLKKKPSQKKRFSIAADGHIYGLSFTKDPRFVQLVSLAPLSSDKDLTEKQQNIRDELMAYTPDQKVFYQIELFNRSSEHLLTFDEAKSSGALQVMEDALLQKEYKRLKNERSSLVLDSNSEVRPLFDVRDEVRRSLQKPLLKKLEKFSSRSQNDPSIFEVRYLPFLKKVKEDIALKKESSIYLQQLDDPIFSQFIPQKEKDAVQKTNDTAALFDLDMGEFSPANIWDQRASFFHVLDKSKKDSGSLAQAKELLEKEAYLELSKKLLSEFSSHLYATTKEES